MLFWAILLTVLATCANVDLRSTSNVLLQHHIHCVSKININCQEGLSPCRYISYEELHVSTKEF